MAGQHDLRMRIMKRLAKMRDELRQIIVDKESWNDNRPKEVPFDVGWDKAMLFYVETSLTAFEDDELGMANHWMKKMQSLVKALEMFSDEVEEPT